MKGGEEINQLTHMRTWVAHSHRQQSGESLRGGESQKAMRGKRDICNTFNKKYLFKKRSTTKKTPHKIKQTKN